MATILAPENYMKDADGFGWPAFGGAAAVRYGTVAYTDTTAKTLFTLPRGSVLLDAVVIVKTAFNGTSPVLDIGLGASANAIADDLTANAATTLRLGAGTSWGLAKFYDAPLAADTAVTATFSASGSPSAGLAVVVIWYALI